MRYGTFFSHIGNPSGNQRPHNSIFVGGTLKGSDYEDKRLKIPMLRAGSHAQDKGKAKDLGRLARCTKHIVGKVFGLGDDCQLGAVSFWILDR